MSQKGPEAQVDNLAELDACTQENEHQKYFQKHSQRLANHVNNNPAAHALVHKYGNSQQDEAMKVLSSALSHQWMDPRNSQAATEPVLEFYGKEDAPIQDYADSYQNEAMSVLSSALSRQRMDPKNSQAAPEPASEFDGKADTFADGWEENQGSPLELDNQTTGDRENKSPELSADAKEYYDTLHNIKDKLVDTSTFMSPQADAILKRYVDNSDGILQRTEWQGENGNAANYTVTLNGEQWNLTEIPWNTEQFPNGLPNKLRNLILWTPDKEKQIEFPIGEVFSLSGDINIQALQYQIQRADNIERMESADNAHAADFDLPKDAPIGYIWLIQSSLDRTVDEVRNDMQYFPELLRSQGYDIQSQEPFTLVNQGDSPRDMIQQQIDAFRNQWTKEIYLNLSGHGSKNEILFGKGSNAPKLNHAEFQNLITQNPDMNFTVSSIACYGWGLLNQDLRAGWDTQEVRVFAQTKTDAYNRGGEFNDGTDKQSTYYNVFFQDALRNWATYGQAHRIADHESQIRSGSNATMVSVDAQWERVTA